MMVSIDHSLSTRKDPMLGSSFRRHKLATKARVKRAKRATEMSSGAENRPCGVDVSPDHFRCLPASDWLTPLWSPGGNSPSRAARNSRQPTPRNLILVAGPHGKHDRSTYAPSSKIRSERSTSRPKLWLGMQECGALDCGVGRRTANKGRKYRRTSDTKPTRASRPSKLQRRAETAVWPRERVLRPRSKLSVTSATRAKRMAVRRALSWGVLQEGGARWTACLPLGSPGSPPMIISDPDECRRRRDCCL